MNDYPVDELVVSHSEGLVRAGSPDSGLQVSLAGKRQTFMSFTRIELVPNVRAYVGVVVLGLPGVLTDFSADC